ncbi:hypothetical protein ACFE04_011003 [Oxalis oulophora]
MSAFFNLATNMYDITLKPRILRQFMRDHLSSDEIQSISFNLSKLVSLIQTHNLLAESHVADLNIAKSWKSAVDEWIERCISLSSASTPDKCWAGICFLGLTCQECSSERFLASYSVWFNKLFSHIQSTTGSQFVKVASCTSITDLLIRLGGLQNTKKDGTSLAGKLIHPLLRLLNDDCSEAVWEAAVHLLCTMINFFPASIQRHFDNVEAAISTKMLSGKCSTKMLKKLAYCLALLPKSKGDESSWSLMMQKILLLSNSHLNDVFQGLEEEYKSLEVYRSLVLPGKDPPPPLGGLENSGQELDKTVKGFEQLLMSRVSSLMLTCSIMLTNPYPIQVTVPINSILALVERVLMVDGSVPHSQLSFMTSMHQELICSELPVLHLYSLDLLTAIIKGMRSQLLPYVASIVRLLKQYFTTCALPELRIKVYSIIKILLLSMGAGIGIYIAKEVVNNAKLDLEIFGNENVTCNKTSSEALLQHNRKRKHGKITGSIERQVDNNRLRVEAQEKSPSTPSLKIAALEALGALLSVVGGLKNEDWRSEVDVLLITMAVDSCQGQWGLIEPKTCSQDLQLAALRALLASLLSSANACPAHLSHGLELFRQGMQETGKVAEFCAHALMALEVLIHPRALPITDFSSTHSKASNNLNYMFPQNMNSSVQNFFSPFASGMVQEMVHEVNLYDKLTTEENESEMPLKTPNSNSDHVVLSQEVAQIDLGTLRSQGNGNMVIVDSAKDSDTSRLHSADKHEPRASNVEARTDVDEVMLEQEPMVQSDEPNFSKASVPDENTRVSEDNTLAEKRVEFVTEVGTSAEKKSSEDDYLDSFPAIVFPDTDEEDLDSDSD